MRAEQTVMPPEPQACHGTRPGPDCAPAADLVDIAAVSTLGKGELRRLVKAIRDLHAVAPTHLRTEPVHEAFRGQTVWKGTVEVFAIDGHTKARVAYAWERDTDDGKRRIVTVLGVPPVRSALDAVRVAVAAGIRERRRRGLTPWWKA